MRASSRLRKRPQLARASGIGDCRRVARYASSNRTPFAGSVVSASAANARHRRRQFLPHRRRLHQPAAAEQVERQLQLGPRPRPAAATARANVCASPAWLTNVPSFSKRGRRRQHVLRGRGQHASGTGPARRAARGAFQSVGNARVERAPGPGSRPRTTSRRAISLRDVRERDHLALEVLQHRLDAAAVRALLGADRELRRLDRVALARPSGTCRPRRPPAPARARAARRFDSPLKYVREQERFLARSGTATAPRRRPSAFACAASANVVLQLRGDRGPRRRLEAGRRLRPAAARTARRALA